MEIKSFGEDAILILGAGLAGLFLAIKLAPRKCIVLSPAAIGNAASSSWAQGGIAAALSRKDSPDLHAIDTVNAGAGLVDEVVAKLVATEGPKRVYDLLNLGVPFDKDQKGELELSLEAAHSLPRVARVAGDLAGREIMNQLILRAHHLPSITILENHWALNLVQNSNGKIAGAIVQNPNETFAIRACHTVLATGGVGGLYAVTTNPMESRGQGLGMAARFGASIANPEFVQFHPTAINVGKDPAPLASEALRGEGSILVDKNGNSFMEKYHKLGNLAPRDIVARAVFTENRLGNGAFLDATKAIGEHFPEHFPTVFNHCMDAGIDPRVQNIPVTPAVHYHMGGVVSDMWAKTTLEGLSAIGECSSTGLHGANRLASNSLLEAVVFANRCSLRINAENHTGADFDGELIVPVRMNDADRKSFRKLMSEDLGVVRNKEDMQNLSNKIDEYAAKFGKELPNEVLTMKLMVYGAIKREESRGGHSRSDFAQTKEIAKPTYLAMNEDGAIKAL